MTLSFLMARRAVPTTQCSLPASGAFGASSKKQPLNRSAYRVWQARILLSRDCFYWSFVFCTYLAYLYKAVPQLCSIGPAVPASINTAAPVAFSSHNSTTWASSQCSTTAASETAAMQQWPFAWQLVCGHLTSSSNSTQEGHVGLLRLSSILQPLMDAAAECKADGSVSRMQRVKCSFLQAAVPAAMKLLKACLYGLQALTIFLGLGWLDSDLSHLASSPIRAAVGLLVLFVPLPLINMNAIWAFMCNIFRTAAASSNVADASIANDCSDTCSGASSSTCSSTSSSTAATALHLDSKGLISWYEPSMYWQKPHVRQWIVGLLRLCPAVTAATLVGQVKPRFLPLTCLKYSLSPWWYLYEGWAAWMLVLVPWKLNLSLSCIEWLITFSTSARLETQNWYTVTGSNSWPLLLYSLAYHFLVSFVFVVVLPSLGTIWLERNHKDKFDTALQFWSRQRQKKQRQHKNATCARAVASKHSGDLAPEMQAEKAEESASFSQVQQMRGLPHDGTCTARNSAPDVPIACNNSANIISSTKIGGKVGSSATSAPAVSTAVGGGTTDSHAVSSMCDRTETLTVGHSSSSRNHSSKPSSALRPISAHVFANDSQDQLMQDIASSLQLAATAAARCLATAPAEAAAAVTGMAGNTALEPLEDLFASVNRSSRRRSSSNAVILPDILPAMRGLLGAEQTADVFQAAAALAARAERKARLHGRMTYPAYRSMSDVSSVSIKLHDASHAAVPTLGPMLTQALNQQLAAAAAADLPGSSSSSGDDLTYVQSACFPGCVQLIANIYGLKKLAALTENDALHVGSGGSGTGDSVVENSNNKDDVLPKPQDDSNSFLSSSDSSDSDQASTTDNAHGCNALRDDATCFADLLLKRVCSKLSHCATGPTTDGSTAQQHQQQHQAAVTVVVDGSTASTIKCQDVHECNAVTAAAAASAVQAVPAAVQLLYPEPCCLVAGRQQQQQLQLSVRVQGSSGSSGGGAEYCCRFLAVQDGDVLLDQDITLTEGESTLSILMPACSPGILHIAILPGQNPTANDNSLAQRNCSSSNSSSLDAASAALLLLQPLLVVPEAAAADMQALYEQLSQPARGDDVHDQINYTECTDACSSSNKVADSITAWDTVSALTVDMAYLLSAAEQIRAPHKATAAAAAGTTGSSSGSSVGLLPGPVAAVLSHLTQHLAVYQAWQVVGWLLKHMEAAAMAAANHTAAEEIAHAAAAEVAAEQPTCLDQDAGLTCRRNSTEFDACDDDDITSGSVGVEKSSSSTISSSSSGADTGSSSSGADTGSSSSSSSAGSVIEYTPETKPSQVSNSNANSGSGNDLKEDAASAAAAAAFGSDSTTPKAAALSSAATAETVRLSKFSKIAAPAQQLLFGFRSRSLETAYVDYVTMQTYLADAFQAVYALAAAISTSVLTDSLQYQNYGSGTGAVALALWEIASRLMNFVCLVVPNFVLLLYRHKLARGGRREKAVIACEWALALCPVFSGLGWMRINQSALKTLTNPALMLTIMMWVFGCFKAACRQVRMRMLLPSLMAELIGAVMLSMRLGFTLKFSLFRYSGGIATAVATAAVLELRSRKEFLSRVGCLGQPDGKAELSLTARLLIITTVQATANEVRLQTFLL